MSVGTVDTQSKTKWHAKDRCFGSLFEYTDTKSVWSGHG